MEINKKEKKASGCLLKKKETELSGIEKGNQTRWSERYEVRWGELKDRAMDELVLFIQEVGWRDKKTLQQPHLR